MAVVIFSKGLNLQVHQPIYNNISIMNNIKRGTINQFFGDMGRKYDSIS